MCLLTRLPCAATLLRQLKRKGAALKQGVITHMELLDMELLDMELLDMEWLMVACPRAV
jgi:hypothetical protein